MVLLSTAVLVASGCAFQFDFFLNANIGAIFLLFGAFGMAITSFAMFVASLINSAATAQTGTETSQPFPYGHAPLHDLCLT